MNPDLKRKPVPYDYLTPGIEAIFTGEDPSSIEIPGDISLLPGYCQLVKYTDPDGNVIAKWSTWNQVADHGEGGEWEDPDINIINKMQEEPGPLDDEVRKIRSHIGHLVPCDNGIPVTIDDLLRAIGNGTLGDKPFHNGCCAAGRWWECDSTQPGQIEAMKVIEEMVKDYLDGRDSIIFIEKYPDAKGFVERTYRWLGPRDQLTELQELQMQRFLLPFDFLTKRIEDHGTVHKNCFEEGGEGEELDRKIAEAAGLPKIYPNYTKEYIETRDSITDPKKKDLYRLCGAMTHGVHGLSDCHHSTYRWLEFWLHGIGTGKIGIPERNEGSERERLKHLLFGYILGLNKWLEGSSMHFTLLDLGYIDLGFDPKNEILRVYALLGEEVTPVKRWLAACLWHNLLNNHPAGLKFRHGDIIEEAQKMGVSLRSWID